MSITTTKIDFSKMNEEEARVLVVNHIKGTRYERYLQAVEDFKQHFSDLFLKQPTHPIFHYELNNMLVDELELSLFYLDNKVLNIDEKSWESRFFDALQIPSEQRTPRLPLNSILNNNVEEIEEFKDENQYNTLESSRRKNFVQQYVDEFNKNSKQSFKNIKNSKFNLKR